MTVKPTRKSVLNLPEGNYIRISIQDHGVGIPEDYLPKIFDPYFSTKQEGSGLGLATVYSIVRNHEGSITAKSQSGVGTTFTLYLPASSETSSPIAEKAEEPETLMTGQGRILVMDDEELVRDVLGEMLQEMGYEADFAHDGVETIEKYKKAIQSETPFDLLVMDLTIPGGMGGNEAIQILREIDPQVKAIVSSGYSEDPIMANFKDYGFSGVISKPYQIEEMGKVLKQVLGEW